MVQIRFNALILSLAVLAAACGRKDSEIPLWKAVEENIPVDISLRYVGSASSPNDTVYVTQGAVCDDEYAYFAFYSYDKKTRTREHTALVSKYRFEEDTLIHVADSPLFKGSHVNSLALDPETHRLYLSGWAVNKEMSRKSLIVLDTRTLEVLPEQETPDFFLTAITYNADRKRFFARSGMKLPIYDRDFNLIDVRERADGSIYTTQGLGSDSHYCYFPLSKSARAIKVNPVYDNHLEVYDWDGNYVTRIVVPFPEESEDLFTRGDHVYVNFAMTGWEPGQKLRHAVYEIVARPASMGKQSLKEYISEDPRRAGANNIPYEYEPAGYTKAPAGYHIAYVSHYGRHGARTGEHRADYNNVVFTLEKAKACGILSADGEKLLQDAIRVVDAHKASNLMLTDLGKEEQQQIAGRFWKTHKTFLRGSSKKVRAVSSTAPRALLSMGAFNSTLQGKCPSLEISTECGYYPQKYMDNNCNPERKDYFHAFRDSLAALPLACVDEFCARIFTDPVKGAELSGDPQKLLYSLYFTARVAPALGMDDCDLYSYIPEEALEQYALSQYSYFYLSHGNSVEYGQERMALNAPLLSDIFHKADAVLSGEDNTAVDLRFGHDNSLRALVSCLGIEGIGERFAMAELPGAMTSAQAIPFSANLQMEFYTSGKDRPVLVKFLWNEKEVHLCGLEPVSGGVYYDWEAVKAEAWKRVGGQFLGALQGKAISPRSGNHEGYQGFDIWGDYALSAQNRGTACVYRLGKDSFAKLGEFKFDSWDDHNHSNVLSFLPTFYDKDDPLPLVAVSRAQRGTLNGLKDEIRVERILPGFQGSRQVRIINYEDTAHDFGYALQWVVDRENGFLYGYGNTIDNTNPANRHRIIKFALPDVLAEGPHMITLHRGEALENYLIEDTYHEPFMPIGQGLFIKDGKLYMPTGFGRKTAPSILYVWDLATRSMKTLDLTQSTFGELEDCSWYDGALVIQAQSGLWKVDVK